MSKMLAATAVSRPAWDTLETFARTHVQGLIQQLLEDEVTTVLGRAKSVRRTPLDAPAGSRNGHGKPRHLALMNGTITVRRPRVRDLEDRFVSRLLPLVPAPDEGSECAVARAVLARLGAWGL